MENTGTMEEVQMTRAMSFESPDVEKEFPGLYASQMEADRDFSEEEERHGRKKESTKKKESKKEKKDKGYKMFEEEDSEEELMGEDVRSPSKMKKHGKPSFKFAKREKFYKPKEKNKDEQKEKELKKEEKKKEEKEHKKKDHDVKLKFKKKKLGGAGSKTDIDNAASDQGDLEAPYEATGNIGTDCKPIFGVSLATAVERSKCHDGIQLPAIFRECIDYIEEFGLACEGIYRISGVKSKVQALKDSYNRCVPAYLHEHEPNIVASLLKQYLRELPEPVLTVELMPKFEQASTIKNVKQKLEQTQKLIEELPTPNHLLLSWTIVHMTHVIAKESQNKMSLQNVSIVLSPTMQISHRVLNVFFTYSKILFRDTVIKKYVPPLRPVSTSRWSLELPDSPNALEEELKKQESLLNQLHEDLMVMKDTEKEDHLWEVQRVVTQLKRKLKNAKKAQEAARASDKKEVETVKDKHQAESKDIPTQEPSKPKQNQPRNLSNPDELDLSLKEPEPRISEEVADKKESKVEVKEEKDKVEEKVKMEEEVDEDKTPTQDNPPETVKFQVGDDENEDSEEEIKGEEPPQVELRIVEEGDLKREEEESKKDKQEKVPEINQTSEETVPAAEDVPHVPEEGVVVAGDVPAVPIIEQMPEESAEQIVEDFSQMTAVNKHGGMNGEMGVSSGEEEDEEVQQMLLEQATLLLEEEELRAIGDELRQKIETEQSEIERLHQEIADLQAIREDLYEEDSSIDSSEESQDEDDLQDILDNLIRENQMLEHENADMAEKIQLEENICLNVKVQIRLLQQQEAASVPDPMNDHSLMIF